ncbi:hypothetical protein TraAM80_00550 [Trypanosoma rangeli]|uniref:Uncharacterized protein n=1 Tax=Trypanosoma rangeli TaxID=5698 RepID=A0A3R7LD25_TRYRA|nr:uncharacterized protein TraAM80_00550 [Trypanosoma rangeli]RNF11990.1 hypothetical protein TraAM80_00550 [Trypanosoma rangeli]|eukprot:RNF11990.1 hypothetical protein TraAM80_00550 [Trypanosoma rangeli]
MAYSLDVCQQTGVHQSDHAAGTLAVVDGKRVARWGPGNRLFLQGGVRKGQEGAMWSMSLCRRHPSFSLDVDCDASCDAGRLDSTHTTRHGGRCEMSAWQWSLVRRMGGLQAGWDYHASYSNCVLRSTVARTFFFFFFYFFAYGGFAHHFH